MVTLFPQLLAFLLGCALGLARGDSVCCDHVGCFTNQEPFDHLYLPECPATMEMKFIMYNRGGLKDTFTRQNIPKNFKPNFQTVFIVHGWRNDGQTGWVLDMKDAFLENADMNVVVVDWATGAGHLFYPYSAANVRTSGAEVASMINLLVQKGSARYDKMWCVGFSIGAHTCGQTGMRTDKKIARVTGLDPAGPSFDGYDIMIGINPSAAKFVDAIHTDGYGLVAYYGTLRPVAHADFYPNEGWTQPGCWTYSVKTCSRQLLKDVDINNKNRTVPSPYLSISCSHGRAPELFISSIRQSQCFTTHQICEDHMNMPKSCNSCGSGPCTEMGFHADAAKSGKFYLETAAEKPFCKK